MEIGRRLNGDGTGFLSNCPHLWIFKSQIRNLRFKGVPAEQAKHAEKLSFSNGLRFETRLGSRIRSLTPLGPEIIF